MPTRTVPCLKALYSEADAAVGRRGGSEGAAGPNARRVAYHRVAPEHDVELGDQLVQIGMGAAQVADDGIGPLRLLRAERPLARLGAVLPAQGVVVGEDRRAG
jgi:hypothetical protein